MTRKDYKMLAWNLNELIEEMRTNNADSRAILAFDRMVSRLCSDLKGDNSNFNSARFRDAVYGVK